MKFKLGLITGAGIGYLVGSGKGAELVDSAKRSVQQGRAREENAFNLTNTPTDREFVGVVIDPMADVEAERVDAT
jgi:hypothetical protein